jgi:hypothetical protein
MDSLDATNRLPDNTHLNDTGAANAALLVFGDLASHLPQQTKNNKGTCIVTNLVNP